jgi:hypothetical protein
MKPNEGSYAENALKYGVSGLNIDGSRIEAKPRKTGTKPTSGEATGSGNTLMGSSKERQAEYDIENKGRFPANIILDEEAGKMLDEQTQDVGNTKPHKVKSNVDSYEGWGNITKKSGEIINYNEPNANGASRFFYCAKASKSERNAGLDYKAEQNQRPIGVAFNKEADLFQEKKVNDGRNTPIDNPYQRGETLRKNTHPTVKPLALMQYLCTLTKTPTGGIVLDPFAGSGTTLMAAKDTGRDFIGIEKEQEYVDIAQARVDGMPMKLL